MTRLFALALLLAAPAAADPISNARQLTFEGARAGEGYFSDDGRRMIFQSERAPGNPFYQIYLLDLETGDVERLSPGVGKTTCGWLNPDGERALFASTQFDRQAEAKMAAERDFRASGETRRYAWDYDPAYDLVETDIGTGGYRRLTDVEGYDAEGAYSPDGSRIVFASNRRAYAEPLTEAEAARLERDPSYFMDLYVMDADGSNLRRLTEAPGYDGGPFWSADGTKITWRRFSEDGARAEVWVMDAEGSDPLRITDLGVLSWAPFFHPSGEYLIFSTNLQGFDNFELYLVDAEGLREPVRVTEREGFDGLAAFAPDGRRISWTSTATADGRSQIFLGDWDHEAARAMLAEAPLRARAAAPDMDQTEAGIAVDDLRRHVAALASEDMEGRLTGTEGERRATAYVADAFAALGLAPEGDGGSMFQGFEFTSGVALGADNRLTVTVEGVTAAPALNEAWRPLAFSKTGEVGEAPVVFVGYGLVAPEGEGQPGLDSYEGIDVEGKWALIQRDLPADLSPERRTFLSRFADLRYRASEAKARGAVGAIFMPPLREGIKDGLPRLTYEAMTGAASLPALGLDRGVADRMLATLGEGRDELLARVEAGEGAGAALPGVSVAAAVDLDFERREGRNVVARLDLAEGDAPPLVIGAHVDHLGRGETSGSLATGAARGLVHVGADDNASGVAALIEIAQALAAEAAAGELEAARDVVFAAWSGEELGLLGATHYVETLAEALGAEDLSNGVSAYLNLDMVGRLEDRVIAGGVGSSPVWPREIERRNVVVGLPLVANDDPYLPTDATAFYLKGVPALSLFTGAHDDYHRPSDTPDKLNYEGLRDIARFTALVARSRIEAAEEPEFVERERPAGMGGRRMSGVFLGTIPDYAEEGTTGVPISGVVKGGPAEAAGLQGGDVIVSLAGEPLADIYDYVRVLNGLTPGRAVAVTVERGGERVAFEVTPGVRE